MFSLSNLPSGLINGLVRRQLAQIESFNQPFSKLIDSRLGDESRELRYRARCGEPLAKLIPQAFALVREAATRILQQRHYSVQLLGGLHLARGRVIEMETGQGKTLTATLPLYLFALCGKGAHLATSNDYLAERDATTMRPLFALLGMSCGYVVDSMPDDDRIRNYACDVTYGTGAEFGFDFLRDRMKRRALNDSPAHGYRPTVVQRNLYYVLADEADSLLIDDASTPLILGAETEMLAEQADLYRWAVAIAPQAKEGLEYRFCSKDRTVEMTADGRAWVRNELFKRSESRQDFRPSSGSQTAAETLGEFRYKNLPQTSENLVPGNPVLTLQAYDFVQKAIKVYRDFHLGKQYLIRDHEIVLINESTGRIGEGRQLQDGMHQTIQARENLPITAPNSHAARITVQGLFLTYQHLSGMSGTAMSAAREFRRVYKMPVVRIPTAKLSRRISLPTRMLPTAKARWLAIADEIHELQKHGRAILVGTRSVEKSEQLSKILATRGIQHTVLNAERHADEAEIISTAGHKGAVMVATGLAGRGTDIKLSDEVRDAGGLHVIMSELHDSKRSDQQLFGRCARQGDPGSYRQYLSTEDEILDLAFGEKQATAIRRTMAGRSSGTGGASARLYSAQTKIERRSRSSRLVQLHYEKKRLRSLLEMGLDPILDPLT